MLRLAAEDEDDLGVISAQMQDALVRREDLRFDTKRRRFALVANRFAWDALPQKLRRRAGLHFEDVNSVRARGMARAAADTVLSLLSITFAKGDDLAGRVTLTFSGAAAIELSVSCINAELADLGGVWAARATPKHDQ